MILSRRVALNNVQLDEVHESVIIRSVVPGVPNESISSVSRMHGTGNRITTRNWQPLETTVNFAIDLPKEDLEGRRAVYDTVTAWALQGGWLSTNEMPNRYMYVDKTVMPGGADLRDWTRDYPLTFKAYNIPFWQSELVSATSGVTNSGMIALNVAGNMDTVMDCTFTNHSGKTINDLSIAVYRGSAAIGTPPYSSIVLENIGLASGGVITLTHSTDGIMRIWRTQGGETVSILDKMSASSSDDSYIGTGINYVSFYASRAGVLTASCRGRYL